MARFSVAQITSTKDALKNFSNIEELFKKAAAQNTTMLCLPEHFAFMANAKDTIALSEPLTGPLFSKYRDLCRKYGIWASYGGFARKSMKSDSKVFNCHVIVSDKGDITHVYDKIHLFDLEKFRESDYTSPGNGITIAELPFGTFGLTVCYDLRFPSLYSAISSSVDKLDAFLIPHAFTYETGASHFDPLIRTRAIEHGVYVLSAAQTGWNIPGKRQSFGSGCVVDPWGTYIVDLGKDENVLGTFEVESLRTKVEEAHSKLPTRLHQRPDAYVRFAESFDEKKTM